MTLFVVILKLRNQDPSICMCLVRVQQVVTVLKSNIRIRLERANLNFIVQMWKAGQDENEQVACHSHTASMQLLKQGMRPVSSFSCGAPGLVLANFVAASQLWHFTAAALCVYYTEDDDDGVK